VGHPSDVRRLRRPDCHMQPSPGCNRRHRPCAHRRLHCGYRALSAFHHNRAGRLRLCIYQHRSDLAICVFPVDPQYKALSLFSHKTEPRGCHSVFSLRSPVFLSFQVSDVASEKLQTCPPLANWRTSGSCPTFPTRITLFTDPAMTTLRSLASESNLIHIAIPTLCPPSRESSPQSSALTAVLTATILYVLILFFMSSWTQRIDCRSKQRHVSRQAEGSGAMSRACRPMRASSSS